MSKPKKLHEMQEEYHNKVVGLCASCGKPTRGGFYGAHEGGGTCSKACEKELMSLAKYPDHSEEEFIKKFNLE